MKLLSSLSAAALAGLAAAGSQDSAEVYLFPFRSGSSDTAAPSIPKELARHVLLQRVGFSGLLAVSITLVCLADNS